MGQNEMVVGPKWFQRGLHQEWLQGTYTLYITPINSHLLRFYYSAKTYTIGHNQTSFRFFSYIVYTDWQKQIKSRPEFRLSVFQSTLIGIDWHYVGIDRHYVGPQVHCIEQNPGLAYVTTTCQTRKMQGGYLIQFSSKIFGCFRVQ